MAFRKIKAGLVNGPINQHVGEIGNLFFDIDTGELRLSDGVTPGGIPILGGGGGGALVIKDDGTTVGTASVLNFGNNITVDVVTGTATANVVPVKISNTAPAAVAGDLWYNPTNAQLGIYYNSFWVSLTTGGSGPQGAQGSQGPSGAQG